LLAIISEIILEPLRCHLELLDTLVFDCPPRLGRKLSKRKICGLAPSGKLNRLVESHRNNWAVLSIYRLFLHEVVMKVKRCVKPFQRPLASAGRLNRYWVHPRGRWKGSPPVSEESATVSHLDF